MPLIDIAETSIHYRFDGPEGAPVLLLSNSLGSNLQMWEPQIGAFAEHFRVLRYDSRGHGHSAVTPGPYSIAQLGRDAIALLDALAIERAFFCGLSKGGMIGIWLAINAASRFDRLIVANTAAKIGTAELWNTRIESVRSGGMAAIADAVVERWFTAGFRERDPAAVGAVRRMLLTTPPLGYIACCAAVRDMDQRAELAQITRPLLVVAGSHDGSTPPADTRAVADAVPKARYAELDASHLSNIEQPERFTAEALRFLCD